MDHVVYVDAKEKALPKLLKGSKRMIIRSNYGNMDDWLLVGEIESVRR